MQTLLEEANEIIIACQGAAGLITLNRPRRRNALSTAMRAEIAQALPGWVRDPNIYAVVIGSAAEQTFCAGGDLRELAEWGRTAKGKAQASLAAEYALNWRLECFTKPTISLIDGLVVGSGVGISLYGTHRVAVEIYRFAMPETGIGLFPDDGVCHAFARMPHEIGTYLALTGRAVGRADAYQLGLVTHAIAACEFGPIRAAIADAEPVDVVLDSRHRHPGPGELEPFKDVVERCFGAATVEEIIARLLGERGAASAWAEAVAEELLRRSPSSLKLTHRHLRLARHPGAGLQNCPALFGGGGFLRRRAGSGDRQGRRAEVASRTPGGRHGGQRGPLFRPTRGRRSGASQSGGNAGAADLKMRAR